MASVFQVLLAVFLRTGGQAGLSRALGASFAASVMSFVGRKSSLWARRRATFRIIARMARRAGHAFGLTFGGLEGSLLASCACSRVNFISVSSGLATHREKSGVFAEVAERAFVAKRLTFLNLVLSMFAMSTEPQPLQAVRTRAAFFRFFAILRTRVACRAKLAGGLAFKGLVSSIGAFKAQIGARCVVCVYRAF